MPGMTQNCSPVTKPEALQAGEASPVTAVALLRQATDYDLRVAVEPPNTLTVEPARLCTPEFTATLKAQARARCVAPVAFSNRFAPIAATRLTHAFANTSGSNVSRPNISRRPIADSPMRGTSP
jgi:hypothetical protein